MELLLLLVAFAVLGYWIAHSRLASRIDRTAETLGDTSRSWADRLENWWRSRFAARRPTNAFQEWAWGDGATYLPKDFRTWLSALPADQAQAFTNALQDYTQSLGFKLDDLIAGSFKSKPALMQVYVEAVVIYSQAFRKAREAHEQAEADSAKAKKQPESAESKKQAEKQASSDELKIPEASQAAPVPVA